jgi:hypothetical protein
MNRLDCDTASTAVRCNEICFYLVCKAVGALRGKAMPSKYNDSVRKTVCCLQKKQFIVSEIFLHLVLFFWFCPVNKLKKYDKSLKSPTFIFIELIETES